MRDTIRAKVVAPVDAQAWGVSRRMNMAMVTLPTTPWMDSFMQSRSAWMRKMSDG